jgi:hypothetical protein
MLIRFSRVVNQHWPLEAYVLLDINQVPFLDSTFEHDVLHDFFSENFILYETVLSPKKSGKISSHARLVLSKFVTCARGPTCFSLCHV